MCTIIDDEKAKLISDLIDMTSIVLNEYPKNDDRYQDAISVLRRWFPKLEKNMV